MQMSIIEDEWYLYRMQFQECLYRNTTGAMVVLILLFVITTSKLIYIQLFLYINFFLSSHNPLTLSPLKGTEVFSDVKRGVTAYKKRAIGDLGI